MKNKNEPHTKRFGWLKNGNPPGDFTKAPRCNAKAKSTQRPCRAPAMINGRCRLHGGCSTGPRTPEGLEKSRMANWKDGHYSANALAMKRYLSRVKKELREYMKKIR